MRERYKGEYHRGIDIFTVFKEKKRNRLSIFMGNDIYLLSLQNFFNVNDNRNIEFERYISTEANHDTRCSVSDYIRAEG